MNLNIERSKEPLDKENHGLLAFIDEYGDPGLNTDKPGCSRLFIVVALIIESSSYDDMVSCVNLIRKKYFSGAELKSSRIGNNHSRRLNLLKEIQGEPFSYCVLVVDKARINKDSGLKYKGSFYKYLNSQLYNHLLRSWQNILITADRIGGQNFAISFERYMSKRLLPDLLVKFDCTMVDSKNEPLVQLADLIAGTLSYVYDPERQNEYSDQYRNILCSKQISIRGWPWKWEHYNPPRESPNTLWDNVVKMMTLNQAEAFLSEHEGSLDEDRQMQVALLHHLLFLQLFEKQKEPVYSDALLKFLKGMGFNGLNRHMLSSRVIGPLRDAGVVISGSQRGYKIALTHEDLQVYVDTCSTIILPMVGRLHKARECVKIATRNGLDILESDSQSHLRQFVEAFEDTSIKIMGANENGIG